MFVDEVDILVTAGGGGNGCVSFRREKFVPRGGPNGGDGGSGGSVYIRASSHLNTLVNFKFHPQFRAERGAHGEGSNRTGRTGSDLILEVPAGTIIYETTGAEHVRRADLTAVGQQVRIATGGRGGRGNQRFATATNRAPRHAERGYQGEPLALRLHLKLLADVGLVGYPNVGKSTLISRLSAARPKISDYPFTTLTPQLGVVRLDTERSFVLADVPGLIEGAHAGHGLGHRFLTHLERTKVLVHLIDVSSSSGRDPVDDLETVLQELDRFPPEIPDDESTDGWTLADKPQLAVASKIDALDDPNRLARLQQRLQELSIPLYPISAITGEGLNTVQEAMWQAVGTSRDTTTRSAQVASE